MEIARDVDHRAPSRISGSIAQMTLPDLTLLFPTIEHAYAFAQQFDRTVYEQMTARVEGHRVKIDTNALVNVRVLELRYDLVMAAKTMGGEEVPAGAMH